MATQVQNRRGTTAEHSTFTGANGELTVDTTKRTLVVHDGATAGGRPLLREDQSNLPTSAPTTGSYNASGALAISTNGTERLRITSAGTALLQGTERLAFNTYVSDSNHAGYLGRNTSTGALVVEAQNAGGGYPITFRTSSTERVRITDQGLVGVGTSSPSNLLHVSTNSNATTTVGLFENASTGAGVYQQVQLKGGTHTLTLGLAGSGTSGSAYIGSDQAKDLTLYTGAANLTLQTNSTPRMTITSGGSVGVGTASPDTLFTCATSDNAVAARFKAANGIFRIYPFETGVGVKITALNGNESAFEHLAIQGASHSFVTGITERLRIDSSGRVGIGTSSPGARLHSVETSAAEGLRVDGAAGGFSLVVEGGTTRATRLRQATIGNSYGGNTPPTDGLLVQGSVGIGTTSPGVNLVVQDATNARTDVVTTGGATARVSSNSTTAFVATTTNHPLAFAVNNGEVGRWDTSGRLLLGTSSARTTQHSIGGNNVYDVVANVQHERTGEAGGFSVVVNKDDASGPFLNLAKARGSSVGSNTIVASGDVLGTIGFFGADGSDITSWGGAIQCFVDGTPGTNDMPGRLVFSVCRDGSASPTEALRISNQGDISHSHQKIGDWAVASYNTSSSAGNVYGARLRFSNKTPNDTTSIFLSCEDSTAIRAEIRSNGGLANYSANNANLSDRNAKKDISPAAGTWDCIKEWEIVNYRYKDQPDDADLNLGVIAQQVAESCPEVITVFQEAKEATGTEPAQEERLGVKEQQMYWMAIKALQEAQARIETLEAKVAALESA